MTYGWGRERQTSATHSTFVSIPGTWNTREGITAAGVGAIVTAISAAAKLARVCIYLLSLLCYIISAYPVRWKLYCSSEFSYAVTYVQPFMIEWHAGDRHDHSYTMIPSSPNVHLHIKHPKCIHKKIYRGSEIIFFFYGVVACLLLGLSAIHICEYVSRDPWRNQIPFSSREMKPHFLL